MRQRPIDGLLDNSPMFRVRSHLIPYILLKLIIIDIHMLTAILLQSLDILTAQSGDEAIHWHREDDHPAISYVLRFEFAVWYDFLIAEEFEAGETFAFVVGIVDCPDLPLAGGQRPLIVLSDVDMVFFLHFASKYDVEVGDLLTGLCDDLPIEVEFDASIVVEIASFFVFEV